MLTCFGYSPDRNQALDFTKGVLVLFMVLYHWMNYFVSIGGPLFTYLRFLPPSFIFISGFVIASFYPAKYGFNHSSLYTRLIIRGVKLLALFTLLNVTANILFVESYRSTMPGVDGFLHDAAAIYIFGNGKATFLILIPISYLLLLAACIFLIGRVYKHVIYLSCAALFGFIAFMDFHDLASPNFTLIGIGLLGIAAGFYPIERINAWAGRPFIGVVILNVAYILAITIWGVNYLLLIIGVFLTVILTYLVGVKTVAWGGIRNLIILLGKYSLFGYIAQIALLQLLHRSLSHLNFNHWTVLITSFIGAFVLTTIAVTLAHEMRGKSYTIDRVYRLAFL